MAKQPTKMSDRGETDPRERAIRRLMEKGSPWDGKRIPRWKAEQVIGPSGGTVERMKADRARKRRLAKRLRSSDSVGTAFKKLCKAGCDRRWLMRHMIGAQAYPWARSQRMYTRAHEKRLQRIIARLGEAGRELQEFVPLMILGDVHDWPVDPPDIPSRLQGIAYCLSEALKSSRWKRLRSMSAPSRILYLIERVREQTGKPHYREMGILLGAAYGGAAIDEAILKMSTKRHRTRRVSR